MRNDQTTCPMSKSPLRIERTARRTAERALPRYSSKYSPHRFTQAQLFACLVLRQFFRTDYRGLVTLLEDFPELRRALKLKCLPDYSPMPPTMPSITLCWPDRHLASLNSDPDQSPQSRAQMAKNALPPPDA